MGNIRIIPRLDIKGPNLVKGIHLEGLRVLGKPEEFAERYYQQGADELIYQDVVASLFERNSLQDIITRTAKRIFIPLTVGGGLRSVQDIRNVLRAGADKVSVNTAALKDPQFIRRAAREFGASTIVVAIEVIKTEGRYLCYTDNGREHTGKDALEWAQEAESLGAGELLLTSVDREGTGKGFDMAFLKAVKDSVHCPLIAHGGIGSPAHALEAVTGGADAIAIASSFHYHALQERVSSQGQGQSEGNTEFLRSGRAYGKIQPFGIDAIKSAVLAGGFHCRPSTSAT